MRQNNQKYILKKLGIPDDMVVFLKTKGLIIPEKIVPIKNPLKSPSEEWFYSVADCYTPPLDDIERNIFIENPHLLSLKIFDSVNLFYDVAIILNNALDKIHNLKNYEDRLVSILSIMWIFHGCLDNNYLKYDRHLEYLDYDISPVGWWWKKFKEYVRRALISKKITKDIDEQVQLYTSKLIKGIRRPIITVEYFFACRKIYKELKILSIEKLTPDEIVKFLKKNRVFLYSMIVEYGHLFYTNIRKFIKESIMLGDGKYLEKTMSAKEETVKKIYEIKQMLNDDKSIQEFERIIEIIEDFIFVQELEGLIAYGVRKNCRYSIFDVLDRSFDSLKEIIPIHTEYLQKRYTDELLSLLRQAKTIPDKYVFDRTIITQLNKYFINGIVKKVNIEVKRWINL